MSRHLKVWLDDERREPDGWRPCRTPAEAIRLLETGLVAELSLDHDLGIFDEDGRETTGYSVLEWIEREVVLNGFDPPRLAVHSANPPARMRMERAIRAIEARSGERP